MKVDARNLNQSVRVMDEEHPLFGETGRVSGFRDGRVGVIFDNPVASHDMFIPNLRWIAEEALALTAETGWMWLYEENKRLRQG